MASLYRHYMSGATKRKAKAAIEFELEKQRGALDKYFCYTTSNILEEQDQDDTTSIEIVQHFCGADDVKDDTHTFGTDTYDNDDNLYHFESNFNNVNEKVIQHDNSSFNTLLNYSDPGAWPTHISQQLKDYLIQTLPLKDKYLVDFVEYPATNGRRFTSSNYFKILPNGETIKREWLIYSDTTNCVSCFCCRLFSMKLTKLSSADGLRDWKHLGAILKSHETSDDHMICMKQWYEIKGRVISKKTIDEQIDTQLQLEIDYWRNILHRLLSIIHFLAEKNLSLRGTAGHDTLGNVHNGNFLGQIELMAKYDQIMAEHIRRIKIREIHDHYLGKDIQNEFIKIISNHILKRILWLVKKAKYYSIILDCTPDISHQEQMTLILRIVNVENVEPAIEEHFVAYINVHDSSGAGLTESLLEQLRDLNLPLANCRGQGYDNGANMKGKHSGVQKRILDLNPMAIYIPCGCHSLNIVLCDAAKSSRVASTYFGNLHRIYRLFSTSTKRWGILSSFVNHVVKIPSETRWESRIASVKVLRFEASGISKAIRELLNIPSLDSITCAEANGLLSEVLSFTFLLSTVIWYDILSQVNKVSKLMQKSDMQLSAAVELLEGIRDYMKEYRDLGFQKAVSVAESLASTFDDHIEITFPEHRVRKKPIRFQDDEIFDSPILDSKDKFQIEFFNVIVDETINKLEERFRQMVQFSNKFGIIHDITSLTKIDDEKLEMG